MMLVSSRDVDSLFSLLPYKTLTFSKIEGRHGIYALIDKNEKPRPGYSQAPPLYPGAACRRQRKPLRSGRQKKTSRNGGMSMNRFTVEETNLISIYIADTRRELIGEMSGALPYMDGEMRELALRTLAKAPRHERRRLCRSRRICRRRSMSGLKRLTPQQSRKVNSLIKKTCCNCIDGNCILLDDGDECVCPQLISIRFFADGFKTPYFPPTSCFTRSFTKQRTGGGAPSAARRLRPPQTVSNTARTAASGSPADKPPSGCGNDAPALRSRREKALRHAAFQTRFEHDRGFIPKPAKTVFYCVTDP